MHIAERAEVNGEFGWVENMRIQLVARPVVADSWGLARREMRLSIPSSQHYFIGDTQGESSETLARPIR